MFQKLNMIETKIEMTEKRNKSKKCHSKAATDTHIILGILVGAGIDQQLHAVRVTTVSGTHQRRRAAPLRARFAAAYTAKS